MTARKNKITTYLQKIRPIDRFENNFIRHNETIFDNSQNKVDQILIEMTNMQPNHIAISHFLRVFSKVHDAQFVGYQTDIDLNLLILLTLKILNVLWK